MERIGIWNENKWRDATYSKADNDLTYKCVNVNDGHCIIGFLFV